MANPPGERPVGAGRWRGGALSATAGRTAGGATVIPPAPLLPAGFFTEHGESDAGESDAGWSWAGTYTTEDGSFWRSGTGPRLEETVVSLDATGLHIHEVAPRSRAEMVELHTAWTQAARVEATAGRAAAAAAAAEAEAEDPGQRHWPCSDRGDRSGAGLKSGVLRRGED